MMTEPATALPADLRGGVERARATLDEESLAALLYEMTSVPSPTGEERRLAELVASHLATAGVRAEVQPLSETQANVVARVGEGSDGPRVLVYAPLDTAFAGVAAEDRPFLGEAPRADFALPATRDGLAVTGLGAENPKAFAAAGIAAIEAIAAAGVLLRGEIVLGLVSGTMPVDSRPGHGTGIRHLLESGPRPDFAVVLKPGWAVVHEEVGLAWFRITVRGNVNYTGIRHKTPYRNPILGAARLVTGLEAWFAEYSARHTDGLVAPQGSINAVRGGSADRAAFVPASCEIDLDLRIGPRTTPDAVEAELRAAVDGLRAELGDLEVEVTRRVAFPGTSTDPSSWIVRSLVRAWESLEGTPHQAPPRQSGASDAAIIRSYGIPAARVGLAPAPVANPHAGFSMGWAHASSVRRLAELLVDALIDTTARSRSEVGLA